MPVSKAQLIRRMSEQQNSLARNILETLFQNRPALKQKYRAVRDVCLADIRYHLDFLKQALHYESPALFEEYLRWTRDFYPKINIPLDEIEQTFAAVQQVLEQQFAASPQLLNPYFQLVSRIYGQGVDQQGSFIQKEHPHGQLAQAYFDLLQAGKRNAAADLIQDAVAQGVAVKELYLQVFQPALREVGRRWQNGTLSVPEEHYFTAATQVIMSQLYTDIFSTPRIGKKMVAACVGRELHEIGVRMVADFFEMAGWDTVYLGANTPVTGFKQILEREKSQLLALSVTLAPHIEIAQKIIHTIRADEAFDTVKILVGGYPFNVDDNLWRNVGTDGYAADAQAALAEAKAAFYYDRND